MFRLYSDVLLFALRVTSWNTMKNIEIAPYSNFVGQKIRPTNATIIESKVTSTDYLSLLCFLL